MFQSEVFRQFARTLARCKPVENILFYPHPLHEGGFILVASAENGDWLEIIGEAQRQLPRGLALHCLRPYELGLLNQPGIFAPPLSINEFPHLLPWLKHRGLVLYGDDIRPALPAPTTAPTQIVAAHIEGCTDTFRRYGILPQLIAGQFDELLAMLTLETKRLMATALLLHRHWEISLEALPDQFRHYFSDAALADIWLQLKNQALPAESGAKKTYPEAARGVWLFERFLARLEQVVLCR